MRYVLSDAAKRDVRKITEFIRRDDPRAAVDVLRGIKEGIRSIAGFPNLGHRHRDVNDSSLLAYGVHKYLVFYKVSEDCVKIVRVLHGARDIKRIFRKR